MKYYKILENTKNYLPKDLIVTDDDSGGTITIHLTSDSEKQNEKDDAVRRNLNALNYIDKLPDDVFDMGEVVARIRALLQD